METLAGTVQTLSDKTDKVLTEVQNVSSNLTSLTRHVDRMDQHLVNVERQTARIPTIEQTLADMATAIGNYGEDLNSHEQRIKKFEQATA